MISCLFLNQDWIIMLNYIKPRSVFVFTLFVFLSFFLSLFVCLFLSFFLLFLKVSKQPTNQPGNQRLKVLSEGLGNEDKVHCPRVYYSTASAIRFEPGTSLSKVLGLIHWATSFALFSLLQQSLFANSPPLALSWSPCWGWSHWRSPCARLPSASWR